MFTLIYILACVLGFAVGIMVSWHLYGVSIGETSVESHDHEVYRQYAKERGTVRFLLISRSMYLIGVYEDVRKLV